MRRALVIWSIVAVVLAAAVAPVVAQEYTEPETPAVTEHAGGEAAAAEAAEAAPQKSFWQFIAAAFAIGIAASFGALGQGRAISAACDAMGRNPGGSGAIRMTMIIGLALIESLVIYALVISFMILTA